MKMFLITLLTAGGLWVSDVVAYDVIYRDAAGDWSGGTATGASLATAASGVQSAIGSGKHVSCIGSNNRVECTCSGGYFRSNGSNCWIYSAKQYNVVTGSNLANTTAGNINPDRIYGVCYTAGTYYEALASTTTKATGPCATAWEACSTGCLRCYPNGAKECRQCKSGYIMFDGECVTDCPSGYAKSGDECVVAEPKKPMNTACPAPLTLSNDGCCCVK